MGINMKKKFNLKKLTSSREASLVIVMIVMCALIQLRNSTFLSGSNVNDILVNNFWIFIPALGMLLVLVIGGIDISIGSTVALSGMAAGLVMRDHPEVPTILLFLVAVVVGLLSGLVIGLVIAKGNVIPIIATMGFMNIYRGATYLIAKSQWIAAYQVPENYKSFALGSTAGVSNFLIVTIICYLVFFFLLKYTTIGRRVYAVGSNAEAASVSGINIDGIKIMVYTVMGTLSGLVGGMWVSKYASAQGDAAKGMEMDVIAACVIGGVSLTGGRGTVLGVFLGALVMAILGNALPLINVSSFVQDAIKGLIIIIAVILNTLTQRSLAKNNLKAREM